MTFTDGSASLIGLPVRDAPVRALLRVVAHRARVEHEHRRVFGPLRQREARRDRAALDVLRVGLVHLAAVRLDVDLRH